MYQNQVILVGRKRYATGLLWQPVAASYTPRNYAKHLVETVHNKLNMFSEYKGMVGLGNSRLRHKNSMPSAAAEVLSSLPDYPSFLGVFRVQNKFYVIATRNSIVLKDELYDSEYIAKEEFLNLAKIPDWTGIFAPATWEIPKSVEKNIDDIITGNAKSVLKPISSFKANFISFVLVGGFIYGFYILFQEPIKEMISYAPQVVKINPEQAEKFKKEIELRELAKADDVLKAAVPSPKQVLQESPKMPYDNLISPTRRAEVCYKATAYLMQSIPGWEQTDVECGEEFATVNFNRTYGTLNDFYDIANATIPGSFVQEITDSDVFVRAKLPESETTSSLEEKDVETISRQITSRFQELDERVNVSISVVSVGGGLQSVPINTVEVSSISKLSPPEYIKIFDDFSGVYLAKTQWQPKSKNWNYEVIIYAK